MNLNEFLKEIQKQRTELDKSNRSSAGVSSFIQIDDEFPKVIEIQNKEFVDNMNELLQKERSKEIKSYIAHINLGK